MRRTSQGSLHTKKNWRQNQTHKIVTISNSLRREDCNFVNNDHMQSSSATHCQRFALSKRYAWRRRKVPQSFSVAKCLKAKSQSGQQDQQEQDARTSCHHPSALQSSSKTCCNHYTIPVMRHSAVDNKTSLSCMTWTRLKKSIILAKSQKLKADINNTEIFELCETSSRKQCLDCPQTGRSALFLALLEDVQRRRKKSKELDKTTTTSCQSWRN